MSVREVHFLHICLVLKVSIIQKVAPSLFYGFTYSIVFLFSKQFIKHKMSTLPLSKTVYYTKTWPSYNCSTLGAIGQDGIHHLYGNSTTKMYRQYFTDYFLYHIIINLTRVTSEANVSMASREAKKARRQKLEKLLRSKLSFRGKCNFFVPIEFIDIHSKETKNKSNPYIT